MTIPSGQEHQQVHDLTLKMKDSDHDKIQCFKETAVFQSLNCNFSPQPPSAFPTYPVQEDIPLGHFPDGCQGVLYNTHDRPVGLRGDDHPGYQGQVRDLSLGFQGLGQVEVHLISIKVSIVWSGYTMK